MVIIKTSPIRIAVALILLICLLTIAQSQTPREVAQKTLPSVVLIIGESNKGKAISLGSGFFVREDIIATNNHVIEGASSLYAKIRGSNKFYALKLIIARPRTDLALLRIVGISKAPLLLANFSQVEVGDEVYAVGNPSGLEGTFSQGLVSGIRKTKDTDYLQISAPISHGSSGGPILNKSGEVIGVAVGGIETQGNLNFAIPVSELSKLMEVIDPDAGWDTSGLLDADKPKEGEEGLDFSGLLDNDKPETDKTKRWRLATTGKDVEVYYDRGGISRTPKGTVKVWIKYEYTKESPYIKQSASLMEYQCADRMSRTLSETHYNQSGEVINSSTFRNLRWDYVAPDTIDEAIFEIVCKGKKNKK